MATRVSGVRILREHRRRFGRCRCIARGRNCPKFGRFRDQERRAEQVAPSPAAIRNGGARGNRYTSSKVRSPDLGKPSLARTSIAEVRRPSRHPDPARRRPKSARSSGTFLGIVSTHRRGRPGRVRTSDASVLGEQLSARCAPSDRCSSKLGNPEIAGATLAAVPGDGKRPSLGRFWAATAKDTGTVTRKLVGSSDKLPPTLPEHRHPSPQKCRRLGHFPRTRAR
jgi:hypothetical protein